MNKTFKWGLLLTLIVSLAAALAFYWAVQAIVADGSDRQQARVGYALKNTDLKRVTNVHTFVADKSYTVVVGKDGQNRKMFVWLARQFVCTAYEMEGIHTRALKANFLRDQPGAKLLRITPGVCMQGKELCWELYFETKSSAGHLQRGYKHYRFRDGAPLLDVRLPAR